MKNKVNVIIIISVLFTGSLFAENLLVNPSFENQTPAFWTGYNAMLNNELLWEQTEVYGGFYSFKVTKSGATNNAVGWISDNNADLYWNNAAAATYSLSAYVKTVGVNTSPANDDAKIGVIFEFKNAAGAELTTQTIWADQSSASVDWAQIQGVAILTEEPASVVVKAIMGKDATGTVYFDNIGCGSDPWSMGLFNGNAETIKGWLNWYGSGNGSYGTVTDNEAHSGSYASELFKPDTTSSTSEIVYYSIPQPVEAGEWYKIGVWVKTADVNDSSAFEPTYILRERLDERIALCYFFHTGDIATEWSVAGGDKFVYIDQRDPATGWTHYVVAEQAPDDATGISVRARFTSNPTGTAWFDNFSAMKMVVATPTITVSVDDGNESYHFPTDFELSHNYPNPFNPVTTIEFAVPHDEWINLTIYNLLGQKVNTLINGVHSQGRYQITWNAQNEFGQPVSSGVYIYTLITKDTRITKKMLLVR
ncbi:MAG: T9SS type A sorting domain-containing protein [Candidatus Marinimicrobia bacterium]|nr:T9SS type A sorting domain-containing protein [Candidatus Neomarinimicrobiota bacterium]